MVALSPPPFHYQFSCLFFIFRSWFATEFHFLLHFYRFSQLSVSSVSLWKLIQFARILQASNPKISRRWLSVLAHYQSPRKPLLPPARQQKKLALVVEILQFGQFFGNDTPITGTRSRLDFTIRSNNEKFIDAIQEFISLAFFLPLIFHTFLANLSNKIGTFRNSSICSS